jgi:cytochrome c oxidase subunit 2
VPTIGKIVDLAHKPAGAMTVDVIAHQWWWEFHYSDPNGGTNKIVVANEMHIPTGRKIITQITSDDVIHSFWVPNLAGKQDAVPNHINDLIFDAREPGVYQGECAEFCLDSHALMHFLVVAEPADQFNAWLTNQSKQQTGTPSSPSAQRGQQVFLGNACIGCHAIEGSPAQGRTAPNLTHVGTRTTIGANRLENTPDNVAAWIHNPQAFKPGAKMPAWAGVLSDDDINAIVDYLESLK